MAVSTFAAAGVVLDQLKIIRTIGETLHPDVRIGGDSGRPVVLEKPDSEYARALSSIAGELARRVSIQTIGVS